MNGGGVVTLVYTADDRLPARRHERTEWRSFTVFPDVVLLEESREATRVDVSSGGPTFVQGAEVSDASGARRARVWFAPGTLATLVLPDGKRRELESFHLRLTEYSVGDRGPAAMPGQLPPSSGYTYATEFGIDEAREAGAVRVELDPPAVVYVDNFLRFPAGTVVPLGYFDAERDVWEPAESGSVISVLGKSEGAPAIDLDGDGEAEDAAALDAAGFDAEELALIGEQFPEETSLWRVSLSHFSPWDLNWPFGPPEGALPPDSSVDADGPGYCKSSYAGSIIGCEDQTLGEALPVAGTPWSLHYQSERAPGRRDMNQLDVRLSGASVPESLKRIELEIGVLGVVTRLSFDPEPGLHHTFVWDGKDAYGRVWQGRRLARVRVGYVYDGAYQATERFGYNGNGVPITGERSRQEVTLWREWRGHVGGVDAQALGFGGWTLSPHHLYDPEGRVLYYGSGGQRSAEQVGSVITTVAGTGAAGFAGDEGPAALAQIDAPHGIVVAADGTAFIADEGNHRIRAVAPDGTISTIAGVGRRGYSGDGGAAVSAELDQPMGLALASDGTLFVADSYNACVRAIRNGRITTIAGRGPTRAPRDGSPVLAVDSQMSEPHALALGPDGVLYVGDTGFNEIYRIAADGMLSIVAGAGSARGENIPALGASVTDPIGLVVSPAGELFFTEWGANRVRRIDASGSVTTVAGTGDAGFSGDGGPATLAALRSPHTVDLGPDGSLYITDEGNDRVRRVRPDGRIETFAGGGAPAPPSIGDEGPPELARFQLPRVVFVHRDSSVWIADYRDARVRRIRPSLPGFAEGEIAVPSESGARLFVFDANGRHLKTLDALTQVALLSFEYTPEGALARIVDANGNATVIERDARGAPTSVVSPFGVRTELALNAAGYLEEIRNADGGAYGLSYDAGGLLTALVDPRDPLRDVHRFEYDTLGRLVKDTSPSGFEQTLTRELTAEGVAVELSSSLGRRVRIETRRSDTGPAYQRIDTAPDGLVTTASVGPSRQVVVTPSGTETRFTFAADPRFGMAAPYIARAEIETGTLPTVIVEHARVAELDDPTDPRTLTRLVETTTVNRRTTTRTYDVAARTVTTVSPMRRTEVVGWDALGRIDRSQRGAFVPVVAKYDARGLVTSLSAGDRPVEYSYDERGFVAGIVDAIGQGFEFGHDAVGRLTSETLPDRSQIDFAYDLNGNLLEVTPQGRGVHSFEYGLSDLVRTYAAPAVGAERHARRFTYNDDEQVTRVEHPDGTETRLEYDRSSGRLTALGLPDATVSFRYDAATGQLISVERPGSASRSSTTAISSRAPRTPAPLRARSRGATTRISG